ncbi:transcriptional regulator [Corynebacterium kozikiae]|uniref:transcriptional regulator n=1 Tax=Corynebacterium kozikiae TaxID=2968469 RepID=UPI00211CE9C9
MSSLDPVLTPLARFKICAALNAFGAVESDPKSGAPSKEMKFAKLRDATELSNASLSKHLGALEQVGYITRFREYGSTRAKDTVWVMLTAAGSAAFQSHWAALRELVERPGPGSGDH